MSTPKRSDRKRSRTQSDQAEKGSDDTQLFQAHQRLMQVQKAPNREEMSASTASDLELLRSHFQFLRDEEEDGKKGEHDWITRMSVRYYQKLFREYALADLSEAASTGRIGLRWRTAMEVKNGKGQFVCGNKKCGDKQGLNSYEVPFKYKEEGEVKQCLVKLRVCENCAILLFTKQVNDEKKKKKRRKEQANALENGE